MAQSSSRPVASVARILIGRLVMSSEFSTTCKIGERFQSPSRPVAQWFHNEQTDWTLSEYGCGEYGCGEQLISTHVNALHLDLDLEVD